MINDIYALTYERGVGRQTKQRTLAEGKKLKREKKSFFLCLMECGWLAGLWQGKSKIFVTVFKKIPFELMQNFGFNAFAAACLLKEISFIPV